MRYHLSLKKLLRINQRMEFLIKHNRMNQLFLQQRLKKQRCHQQLLFPKKTAIWKCKKNLVLVNQVLLQHLILLRTRLYNLLILLLICGGLHLFHIIKSMANLRYLVELLMMKLGLILAISPLESEILQKL